MEQLLINMSALSFSFFFFYSLSVEEEEEDEEMMEAKPGPESEQQDEDDNRETKEGKKQHWAIYRYCVDILRLDIVLLFCFHNMAIIIVSFTGF